MERVILYPVKASREEIPDLPKKGKNKTGKTKTGKPQQEKRTASGTGVFKMQNRISAVESRRRYGFPRFGFTRYWGKALFGYAEKA